MTYIVMTKHPIFGEIVVDVLYDRESAEHMINQQIYGDCWIEEMEHVEGEV